MLWFKRQSPRLDNACAELGKMADDLASLEANLDALLICEPPDTAAIRALEAKLTDQRATIDRQKRLIALIEKEAADQERAAAASEMAKGAAKVESVVNRWDENASKIEKNIGDLAALYREQVKLGEEIDTAWPWNDHERGSIKLAPADFQEMAARELFRAGAVLLSPAELTGSSRASILPGAKCPLGDEMMPQRIPTLSATINERAAFAIDCLRAAVRAKGEEK